MSVGAGHEVVHVELAGIQHEACSSCNGRRHRWPVSFLRTPKGWTGPREVDGQAIEGTCRAHQDPSDDVREAAAGAIQLLTRRDVSAQFNLN